jgi:CBS-domain-containing membrane protein
VTIDISATLGQAAALFIAHRIGTLPVIGEERRPVGLLQLEDLLRFALPDFVQLLTDFDFVHDFGIAESQRPPAEVWLASVKEAMQPNVAVPETCGLIRAFALLRHHHLHDLPVVAADGRLIGLASRVDIGTALLSGWNL